MRIVLADGVMHGELALFGQEQDAGTGELLGNRSNGKAGVTLHRERLVELPLTIAFGEDRLSVAHDRDGQSDESLRFDIACDVRIDRRQIKRLGRLWRLTKDRPGRYQSQV